MSSRCPEHTGRLDIFASPVHMGTTFTVSEVWPVIRCLLRQEANNEDFVIVDLSLTPVDHVSLLRLDFAPVVQQSIATFRQVALQDRELLVSGCFRLLAQPQSELGAIDLRPS